MNDVTFVGLKSQKDVISEKVAAAIQKGDVIDVDQDSGCEEEDILNDDEVNSSYNKQTIYEHAGEKSSQSSSNNDDRSLTKKEREMLEECEGYEGSSTSQSSSNNDERSLTKKEREMLEECEGSEGSSIESEQDEQESSREGMEEEEEVEDANSEARVSSSMLFQLYQTEATEMESTCPRCDKTIERQESSMICNECNRNYHNHCLENEFNICKLDFFDDECFVCPFCKQLKGCTSSSDSDDSEYVDCEDEDDNEAESS
eukprot:scaffold14330_cov132-Skeletonema_marinoi.AAC.3